MKYYFCTPPSTLSFLDFYQEGTIGLLRAGREHDPARGIPFKNHAARCIRDNMLGAVFGNETILDFFPEEVAERQAKITEARERLAVQNPDHQPTLEELSSATGLSKKMIVKAGERLERSCDQTETDQDIAVEKIAGLVSCTQLLEQLRLDLDTALSRIPGRDAEMVKLHLIGGKTLEEVGEMFGVTRQRVHAIVKKSCEILAVLLSNYSEEE